MRATQIISKWWGRKWDWQKPGMKVRVFKGSQREFETAFFEGIVARQGDYWEVLAVLADHYTTVGRYREGLSVDRRLATLRPHDPVVQYNLACSYSLVGRIEQAGKALEKALALGYRDFRHLFSDTDLAALRRDKRFKRIMNKYVKA